MSAATFNQEAETAWNTAASKTTAPFNVLTGQVLVAWVTVEGNPAGATTAPTITGGSLTWTSLQDVNVDDYTRIVAWTATVDTGKSMTVTVDDPGSTTNFFGGNVLVFNGSSGVGASSKTNIASGAPSLALTTTQDDSIVVGIFGDWTANGGARTWRTVNSITPTSGNGLEVTYFSDGAHYTSYGAYWSNVGTAGSKTVGLTAPTGLKYSGVAVEVKGLLGSTTNLTISATCVASVAINRSVRPTRTTTAVVAAARIAAPARAITTTAAASATRTASALRRITATAATAAAASRQTTQTKAATAAATATRASSAATTLNASAGGQASRTAAVATRINGAVGTAAQISTVRVKLFTVSAAAPAIATLTRHAAATRAASVASAAAGTRSAATTVTTSAASAASAMSTRAHQLLLIALTSSNATTEKRTAATRTTSTAAHATIDRALTITRTAASGAGAAITRLLRRTLQAVTNAAATLGAEAGVEPPADRPADLALSDRLTVALALSERAIGARLALSDRVLTSAELKEVNP